jgi:hypothetical protein
MDGNMYDIVQKILYGVSFIAVGGALAMMFFFIFAQSILGSRAMQEQLEHLRRQAEEIKNELERIREYLGSEKQGREKED